MTNDKGFLTYEQQIEYLRVEKKISCNGVEDKQVLCRSGYFNLVNGYKKPFVCGMDGDKHRYLPRTDIKELNALKQFDYELRMHLLKYITKIEEEVRTFSAYKFDELNNNGKKQWYTVDSYDELVDMHDIIEIISKIHFEIKSSKQDYVLFYLKSHKFIPTWIIIKIIKFSTLIDFIDYSKDGVKKSLCELYGIMDTRGKCDYKLFIGSLHWMRKVRNSCAHNERVYSMCRQHGRIKMEYFNLLGKSYNKEHDQKIIDLIVYMKFYLPYLEYNKFITEIQGMLIELKININKQAFENVRSALGIKDLEHLNILLTNSKEIVYNKF